MFLTAVILTLALVIACKGHLTVVGATGVLCEARVLLTSQDLVLMIQPSTNIRQCLLALNLSPMPQG